MGVTCPPGRNTRDRERKGQGDVRGVAVGSEADFPTNETLETTQGGIVARLPRIPDLKRSLSLIHVTRALNPESPVNFMATVPTVSTDNAIQAGSDGGDGIFRFAENPHLDHVARFPIVRRGFETRGDYYAVLIFMKEKAIAHREPPTINSAKQ